MQKSFMIVGVVLSCFWVTRCKSRVDYNIPPEGEAVLISTGDPDASGGLTARGISSTIRQNLNQIRHCYERYLQRAPGQSGQVKVKFVINPSGYVASTSIRESSFSDLSLHSCITGRIKKFKFPRPRGGLNVEVTYPFIFRPL